VLLNVEHNQNYRLGIKKWVDLDRLLMLVDFVESQWLPSIAAAIIFAGILLFLWFMSTLMTAPTM